MEQHLNALAALIAPPFLHDVHDLLPSAPGYYQQFVDAVVKGIDNLDDAELLRATELMDEGTAAARSYVERLLLCG